MSNKTYGSGGIRTHASEETGALNQRLRPLGHATYLYSLILSQSFTGKQELPCSHLYIRVLDCKTGIAPGEARTHGLQIMRLTRCLLRYGGLRRVGFVILISPKYIVIMQRKKSCVGRESNPGQLLGRQLCSPLYHRRSAISGSKF